MQQYQCIVDVHDRLLLGNFAEPLLLLNRVGDKLVKSVSRLWLNSGTYAGDICVDMAIQDCQGSVLVQQAPFPHQCKDGREHPDVVSIHVP
jgi:hypothetical protein